MEPEKDEIKDLMVEIFETTKQETALVKPDRLTEWYIDQFAQAKELKERIKKQTAIMLKEVDRRVEAIQYFCGSDFHERVDRDLYAETNVKKDGTLRKKSINYHTGKAGYRKSPERIKIVDEEKAKEWMFDGLPYDLFFEAIHVKKTMALARLIYDNVMLDVVDGLNSKPFLDHLEATGELPDGCEIVESKDVFFPAVKAKELKEGEIE